MQVRFCAGKLPDLPEREGLWRGVAMNNCSRPNSCIFCKLFQWLKRLPPLATSLNSYYFKSPTWCHRNTKKVWFKYVFTQIKSELVHIKIKWKIRWFIINHQRCGSWKSHLSVRCNIIVLKFLHKSHGEQILLTLLPVSRQRCSSRRRWSS